MQVVLSLPPDQVYYFFAITCLTAPFIGVIIGGIVTSYVGGYNSPKAFKICVGVGAAGLCVALPIPLATTKPLAFLLVWLLLCLGSFLVPTLTGIMLNSVSE